MFDRCESILYIKNSLDELQDRPIEWIVTFIKRINRNFNFQKNINSDIVNDLFLQEFGDNLRVYHYLFSTEPFTKDRFEYLFEHTLKLCDCEIIMPGKGNPGHDITVDGIPISLKTQADRGIKENKIYISKFMELGKGDWSDDEGQLIGLRERFFNHMRAYERIFTLRCLKRPPKYNVWEYELVEIPKSLFLEAENGNFEMMHNSRQMPKPGYCRVFDDNNVLKYALYFDGGTERKLQIKDLDKSYCKVHAKWSFPV